MAVEIKDLQAILDINRKINSIEDVRVILNDISEHSCQLLNAEGASILLVDPDTENLYFEAASGESSDALYDVVVPKGRGIAGYAAEQKKHIIVYDAQNDKRFYKEVDEKTNLKTKSLLAMPLIHNERVIGVIEVINPAEGVFTEDDVILLRQFAEQAATAIANALLYKTLQNRAKELEYLYQISNLTNMTYDRKVLFGKVVELLAKIFNSKRVSIMLVDEENGKFYIESALGLPPAVLENKEISMDDDKISCRALKLGKTIYSNDIERDGVGRNKRLRYKCGSFVCTPIKIKNFNVGVINISEPHRGFRYTPEMIKTLQTIANQVGQSYESILSYNQRIETEKIRKEMDIMKMIQTALLVKNFSDFKNVSIYARMKAAEIVGGDFYDVYQLSPGKIGFAIGDVSGKGLPASLYMAVSRSVLKSYAHHVGKSHRVLEYANDILVDDSRVGMFVTMFYGIFDVNHRIIEYANAGHNLQYVYRPSKDKLYALSTKGIPVGISKRERYVSARIQLESGDIVICFTDGIIDAVNKEGENFGFKRLENIIKKYSPLSATVIVNSIFREVEDWASGAKQWDDMTLLVLKVP